LTLVDIHCEKVAMFCALGGNCIIGPHWFQDADGRLVIIYTGRLN